MDRKYLLTALGYGLLGLLFGIYMAHSHDYVHHVTHAHIMLLGFVVSFVYAVCHKLWLTQPDSLAGVQYWLHQLGTVAVLVSMFLYYDGYMGMEMLAPVLALASLAVVLALLMLKVMIIRATRAGQ